MGSDVTNQIATEKAHRINEDRLRGQNEAFQAAINGAPLHESLAILAQIVSKETAGAVRTAFYIANQELTYLHPIPGAGDMPDSYTKLVDRFPIGHESLACGLASATGCAVLTQDVFEEVLWKPWVHLAEAYDFCGCWSFPIETRDHKPVGTFAMYFREPPDAARQEISLAEVVTQAAAIIISRHTEFQERLRAEATLRHSEQRFRLLVENVREYALVQTDKEGRVTSWNPGARRLFGHCAEHMLGVEFSALLTPEDEARGLFREELAAAVAGRRREIAGWLVRQDGSRFWARWITEPIYDDSGRFQGLVKIIRDETEREETERFVQRSLAEKEELLKEVHHRVKNNLQVISSLVGLQATKVDDPGVIAAFDETRNRVYSIATIHEMLYQSTAFEAIDMVEYARRLVPDVIGLYGRQGAIRVEISGEGTIELERAVPYGLLLNELVSNVCKHAFPNDKNGELLLSFRRGNGQILMSVSDDGVGLPVDLVFERANSLGLKLVVNLARQLRATLDVQSGFGTRVTVTIPERIVSNE